MIICSCQISNAAGDASRELYGWLFWRIVWLLLCRVLCYHMLFATESLSWLSAGGFARSGQYSQTPPNSNSNINHS